MRVSKYQKVVNEYIIEYGVRPSNDYLCYRLGINYKVLDKLKQIVYAYNSIKSLDEPYGEEDECYMYEIIPGRDCVENEAINNSMEQLPDIWDIIKDYIPHVEYEVIRMRFQDKQSLEAIGKQLGMSREAVRKIDASSMRHLRYRKIISAISERYDVVEMKHRFTLEPHEAMAQKIQTSKQNAVIRRRNCLSIIHGPVQRREQL